MMEKEPIRSEAVIISDFLGMIGSAEIRDQRSFKLLRDCINYIEIQLKLTVDSQFILDLQADINDNVNAGRLDDDEFYKIVIRCVDDCDDPHHLLISDLYYDFESTSSGLSDRSYLFTYDGGRTISPGEVDGDEGLER
jgi:hypothetical protein